MALKAVVTSLDAVPEALREFYQQGEDGKFRLAADGMVDKAKLDEFRQNNITLRKTLDELGVDADEVARLRQIEADLKKEKAKGAGDWDAREKQIRDEMIAAATKERKKLEDRTSQLMDALDSEVRRSKAVAAIAELKGSPKVLLPHVLSRTKTVEQDGRWDAVVIDDNGQPRYGANGTMSIADFVAELKSDPDFARNFEGSGSTGGGATKSTAGGGGPKRTISATDTAAFMANLEAIAKGEVAVQ